MSNQHYPQGPYGSPFPFSYPPIPFIPPHTANAPSRDNSLKQNIQMPPPFPIPPYMIPPYPMMFPPPYPFNQPLPNKPTLPPQAQPNLPYRPEHTNTTQEGPKPPRSNTQHPAELPSIIVLSDSEEKEEEKKRQNRAQARKEKAKESPKHYYSLPSQREARPKP